MLSLMLIKFRNLTSMYSDISMTVVVPVAYMPAPSTTSGDIGVVELRTSPTRAV